MQAPAPEPLRWEYVSRREDCSEVSAPVPAHGIVDADGRRWELAHMPEHVLVGLDLRGADWHSASVSGAMLIACDFRDCELADADFSGCDFAGCDLRGADLTDPDLTDATFDRSTRWPAGFNPRAHGARLEE